MRKSLAVEPANPSISISVPHETIQAKKPEETTGASVAESIRTATPSNPMADREIVCQPLHFASDRLTWSKSSINEVKYNPLIKQWMDYNPAFANWVRSCVMLHADNAVRQADTVCKIPDMWKDEIGESITIVSANCIPGRNGFEYKAGVIHVMA